MKLFKCIFGVIGIGCLCILLIKEKNIDRCIIDVVTERNVSFEKCSIVHPDYGQKMLSNEEISSLREYLYNESCTYSRNVKGFESYVYDGTLFHIFLYTKENELEASFILSDIGKMYVNHKEYVLLNNNNPMLHFLEECYN